MSDVDEINLKELVNNKFFWPVLIGLTFMLSRLPLINVYQTFWWDESQYLLMIKHLFLGTPITGWWAGRSLIQSYFMYLLTLPFGFNELALRVVNLLTCLGFVIASYYFVKRLLNNTNGVIAGFIMTFSWVILYWSLRINIDMINAFLLTLSAYYYLGSSKRDNFLSGLFLGLALNFRFTGLITGLIYLIHSFVYRKNFDWIKGSIIGFIPLAVNDLILYSNPFSSVIEFVTGNSSNGLNNYSYYLNSFVNNFGLTLSVFIIIGLIALFNKVNEKKSFILLNIFVYLGFYSFMAAVKDLRFIIHLMPFFITAGLIGMKLIIKLFTNSKNSITYAIIILSIIICFTNFSQGLTAVNNVKSSYNDVRLAGLFIKANGGGKVISNSVPQITYYSEQETYRLPDDYQSFINEAMNASWVIVSVYEPHPQYAYNLNESWLVPVKALPDTTNTRLIIYLVNKSMIN